MPSKDSSQRAPATGEKASVSTAESLPVLRDVAHFPQDLEYSQDTYKGRFMHFFTMTDPRTLLTSPAKLAACQSLLAKVDRREAGWGMIPVRDYVDARRRVTAIVHPETQKPILWPFRFSAYIPMNFVNLCGMLAPSMQTPGRAMFWQFSNQTYNVGFNYCNGSGKDGLPVQALLAGYVAATVTACGLSYYLGKLASTRGGLLRVVIPYTAVACANLANLGVIRGRDLVRGIAVQDAVTGEAVCNGAPSPTAGRVAVTEVGISRVLIPLPLMLIPPVFLNALFDPKHGVRFFVKRTASLYIPVNVATLVGLLMVALPMSIAVFPQETTMSTRWLEPQFQHQKNSRGEEITMVRFNKGL